MPNPHRLFVPLVLIWVIACASVLPALAAPGQITGLSVSPFPAQVHNLVNVTVDGNGSCTCSLNFGDSSTPVRRTGLLSFQQTHIYARSGTYWLHAKAISGCSGQAESTIEVQFSTVDFHNLAPKPYQPESSTQLRSRRAPLER